MSAIIENPESYFRQFIPARDPFLMELEAEAQREAIPIVGPVVGEFLFILVRAAAARTVLELGTATGYSAVFLARACEPVNGRVLTLEQNPERAKRALKNFKTAGLHRRIEVRICDALQEISEMKTAFDFIFLDIGKEDYPQALSHCHKLLKKGGLLVADNVGFKEADEFNRAIAHHPRWRAVSIFSFLPLHSPEKDAICLALRQ